MKFLRWGEPGNEKPGVVDDAGNIRDLTGIIQDINPQSIADGSLSRIGQMDLASLDLVPVDNRLGSCIGSVPNFYCIGLNYHKPDAPVDMQSSSKVVITSKSTSALSGANDDIYLPSNSEKTDWEVELGVVIGRECWQCSIVEAMDHVFGYCIVNDICERDYMFEHGGQWIKGKSLPGYGPAGPWLVSRDEITDPQDLRLWLKRNGHVMQDSSTAQMVNSVAQLVAHMSHYMKLMPGDLIATGTPAGIGMHMSPPAFLQEGDRIELGITGLGEQRATVRRIAGQ